jgi:hypothetical protein
MEFGCTGAAVLCLFGAIAISAMGGKLFPAWTAWPWWAKAISIAAAAALLLAGAALDEAGRWPKYIPPAGGEQDGDGKDTT